MTSPYEVIVYTCILAAFGYFFPRLMFALNFGEVLVPFFTVVGLNLMAYWMLIPSFKHRKECKRCGETSKGTAKACENCKKVFPPETSPYEVLAFAATIFIFGWSFPKLLEALSLNGWAVAVVTVPALLFLAAWLLLPSFKHKQVCGRCTAVNWKGDKECFNCGEKLA